MILLVSGCLLFGLNCCDDLVVSGLLVYCLGVCFGIEVLSDLLLLGFCWWPLNSFGFLVISLVIGLPYGLFSCVLFLVLMWVLNFKFQGLLVGMFIALGLVGLVVETFDLMCVFGCWIVGFSDGTYPLILLYFWVVTVMYWWICCCEWGFICMS